MDWNLWFHWTTLPAETKLRHATKRMLVSFWHKKWWKKNTQKKWEKYGEQHTFPHRQTHTLCCSDTCSVQRTQRRERKHEKHEKHKKKKTKKPRKRKQITKSCLKKNAGWTLKKWTTPSPLCNFFEYLRTKWIIEYENQKNWTHGIIHWRNQVLAVLNVSSKPKKYFLLNLSSFFFLVLFTKTICWEPWWSEQSSVGVLPWWCGLSR